MVNSIFIILVIAMDLHIVVMLLFYSVVKGEKQALRTGGSDIATVPEILDEKQPSKVLAVVVVEDVDESEETDPPLKSETPMLPWIENPEIMLPWIEDAQAEDLDEDTSGESNSDEYPDSDANDSYDTDSESNFYHEDDYLKEKLKKEIAVLSNEHDSLLSLRNRWKSCQKKASKYCRKACVASYKNACTEYKCKSKLKKRFKKECKRNCVDYFVTD